MPRKTLYEAVRDLTPDNLKLWLELHEEDEFTPCDPCDCVLARYLTAEMGRQVVVRDPVITGPSQVHAFNADASVPLPKWAQKLVTLFDDQFSKPVSARMIIALLMQAVQATTEMTDEYLREQWQRFRDVPIDDDGCLLEPFEIAEIGTWAGARWQWRVGQHREMVWRWFDKRYSGGVIKLMFPGGDA